MLVFDAVNSLPGLVRALDNVGAYFNANKVLEHTWTTESGVRYNRQPRKPIECAPEASRGGRESMEMAEGIHLDLT